MGVNIHLRVVLNAFNPLTHKPIPVFKCIRYSPHTALSVFLLFVRYCMMCIGPCTWDCYLYRDQLACCSLILQGED